MYFPAEIDVLHFQTFQFKKQNGPAFIHEGQQSVYTVLMDGPPDSDVTLELATAVDGYIKYKIAFCMPDQLLFLL